MFGNILILIPISIGLAVTLYGLWFMPWPATSDFGWSSLFGYEVILLPGSYTVGLPGGDIHYAGTLPMRDRPVLGETSSLGEVEGIDGVYVVDGACLPALPAKSHTLTIMANADRIGSAITKSLRGEFV